MCDRRVLIPSPVRLATVAWLALPVQSRAHTVRLLAAVDSADILYIWLVMVITGFAGMVLEM